jgi:hypothetical protein
MIQGDAHLIPGIQGEGGFTSHRRYRGTSSPHTRDTEGPAHLTQETQRDLLTNNRYTGDSLSHTRNTGGTAHLTPEIKWDQLTSHQVFKGINYLRPGIQEDQLISH